jgi:hypothetical protein
LDPQHFKLSNKTDYLQFDVHIFIATGWRIFPVDDSRISPLTPGFAPPPSIATGDGYAATAAAAETVTFAGHHHNTSFSPGKEFMPAGKEVMKKAPLVILKTKRLLRDKRKTDPVLVFFVSVFFLSASYRD